MSEDRVVEVMELGARLDPELLDEDLPHVAVGLQRVGLAAAAIEREHQVRVQPFTPRVLVGELLKFAGQFGMAPGGEAIVRHPEISMVSLTGSVGTGRGIARAAADTLKRVPLELGGKAPVVVFDDADPEALAESLRVAAFCNSGQDRTAAARVLASPGIYDAVLDELVPATASLAVGDPAEGERIEMATVISARQQTACSAS